MGKGEVIYLALATPLNGSSLVQQGVVRKIRLIRYNVWLRSLLAHHVTHPSQFIQAHLIVRTMSYVCHYTPD